MRRLILIAALLLTSAAAAQIINEGASFVSGGGGGNSGPVALLKQTENTDGTTFTIVGKSTLDFDHAISVRYRHIPGIAGKAAGYATQALTYTDYFADHGLTHDESKLITSRRLFHGDSLYVRVVVATSDSSVVLNTLERGYLIQHPVWRDGKAFCLVVSADDGDDGNLAWSAAADSMGWTYTLNPSLAASGGVGAAGMLTPAQLATVASRGVEIGYTGNHHRGYGAGVFPKPGGAVADTLVSYLDPGFFEAYLGTAVTSFAADLHWMSWRMVSLLDSIGYGNCRGGYWDGTDVIRGYDATAPGNSMWDWGRPLNWYKPSAIYGYSSWRGENSTDATNSLFGTGAGSATDSISVRLNRFCNQSARNGFAPIVVLIHDYNVTREDLETLVTVARARGDIWIAGQQEMIDYYTSKHVAVNAPGWAPYARISGVVAADGIFYDLAKPTYTEAEEWIFSNTTTAVNVATYDHSYTDGMTFGSMRYDDQNHAAPTSTSDFVGRIGLLPMSTSTENVAWVSFNVDELDVFALTPEKIVEATFHTFVDGSSLVDSINAATGLEDNYFAVVGNTSPVLFEACDESDSSFLYSDTSASTAWSVAMSAFTKNTDWGDYVYARHRYAGIGPNTGGAWVVEDVTDYIRDVVKNNRYSAAFVHSGNYLGGTRYIIYNLHNVTAAKRPYLVVKVAQ